MKRVEENKMHNVAHTPISNMVSLNVVKRVLLVCTVQCKHSIVSINVSVQNVMCIEIILLVSAFKLKASRAGRALFK